MHGPTPDRLRDERGFALMLTLMVLVLLGIVSAGTARISRSEARARNRFSSSYRAEVAANAGLEHATAHFVINGDAGWPVAGSVDNYAYSVTLSRDTFDFGFGAAPVSIAADGTFNGAGNGADVMVVRSTATRGTVRARQSMRFTNEGLSIDAEAALTANSSIELSGSVSISGINVGIDGTPIDPTNLADTGACQENKPAVTLTDASEEVEQNGSSNLYGHANYAGSTPPYVAVDSTNVWHSPEQVLGLDSGALDSYLQSGTQYAANRPDTLTGITYIDDDFGSTGTCASDSGCGNIQGTGILIVHNPLYDPREHDPDDPMYDSIKANDSRYAPANIGNINGGTFHGIIIADKIAKINGSISIYGAVISLSEIDVNLVGAGTAGIHYSCDSINLAANTITIVRRLSWVRG